MLKGKKIILGITGSIAAYKIPLLVRLLKREQAEVQVLMTPSATDFVTPLTLATLSQKPVLIQPFDKENGEWNSHVELGNWADLIVIAPVSANTLGKMANGLADNLLLTTYLAAKCLILFAPAMDLDMYKHPATQKNIETLVSYGHKLIAPKEGELASGLCGAGRLEEPENILQIIIGELKKKLQLKNKTALVTAGPTYEAIDPVRFIGNHASGLMGFEIASALAKQGAKVTLITGLTQLSVSDSNINRIDVVSAEDMYQACTAHFLNTDITVMAAAVADYTPRRKKDKKIKKEDGCPVIELTETKDIAKELGKMKRKNQILVGFALETDNEITNARKKLNSKNFDFIVLNSLNDKGAGFDVKTNKISIIDNNNIYKFELKSKKEAANDIVEKIITLIK